MTHRTHPRRTLSLTLLAILASSTAALAAPQATPLAIHKIDPPNWFASLPRPLLLVNGEGLSNATFTLSDPTLRIERVFASDNGHWAQLWLSASPAAAETVTLTASHGAQHLDVPYTFSPPRSATDGMSGFSDQDVMYLIMTDRFADGDLANDGPAGHSAFSSAEAAAERARPRGWHGGDLRGITQHLDYLQSLGVTTIWTTPVYQNHGVQSYHGYGATDLYQVDEHFGSLADLQTLAAALHARHMKLVLDTVPNHVGAEHPWVRDEPTPDWFHGTAQHHLKAETDFRALIDPHATGASRIATLQGWFGDLLPDMNTEDPTVAQYLRQNAVWWIEQTGADGLRIDTFPYVDRPFWNAFNGELKQLFPHLTEVGEVFNSEPEIVSSFAGGVTRAGVDTQLTTPFDFPTYFAVRDVFAGGAPMSRLARVLGSDALYPQPGRLVPFLGNHDTTRFMEAAHGASIGDLAALRLAFAYLLTTRGTPQLYAGDELALRGGDDPDNRHDFPGGFPSGFSGGLPGGFPSRFPGAGSPTPATTPDAFTGAHLTADQTAMLHWVSELTALRRDHSALRCGGEQVLGVADDWLVIGRDPRHAPSAACPATAPADGRMLVVFHRGQSPMPPISLHGTWFAGCQLRDNDSSKLTLADDTLQVPQPAGDLLIAVCR